jgi:hypothetical protein
LAASAGVSANYLHRQASLELAREALIRDDGDENEAEVLVLGFRDAHYARMRGKKWKDAE